MVWSAGEYAPGPPGGGGRPHPCPSGLSLTCLGFCDLEIKAEDTGILMLRWGLVLVLPGKLQSRMQTGTPATFKILIWRRKSGVFPQGECLQSVSSALSYGCKVLCLVAQLCPAPRDPMDCSPPGTSVHGDSPGKTTGVDCHAPLQGIFPTQGSNPGLWHCRQILCHQSHEGSPLI